MDDLLDRLAAARAGLERWVKLIWVRRAYQTREATPGYAPDPDFSKLPPFDDLVTAPWNVRTTTIPVPSPARTVRAR